MSLIPLWSADNHTLYSDMFNIAPGKVCVLTAANLACEKVRTTDLEFIGPQAVCIHRVIHMPEAALCKNVTCDWVIAAARGVMVAEDEIPCWVLTPSDNIRIIGLPGTYRLELNDATAIGVAQVYAELFDASVVNTSVTHLFF